jgi:hypothetical protein
MDFKNTNFDNKSKWFNNDIKKNLFNFFSPDTNSESLELKKNIINNIKINDKKEKDKDKKDKKDKEDEKKNDRNLKTGFYWEDLDQKYPYDPKLKYCIYFKGCCCPPHKGHINSIKNAVKIFGDCKIIVNQTASSSRHGTPTEFNSELLQKYLKIVFPNNNVLYLLRASSDKVFRNNFIRDIDVLVIIRGDEIENNYLDKYELIDMYNKKKINSIKKHKKFLYKNKIKVDFIMQKRNVNKLSATKFIESVNKYKAKLSKGTNVKKELENVMNFIPDELSYDEKYEIVNKIIKYKTWSEK